MGADNPAAQGELTLDRLAALPHLVIAATGEDERAIEGYVVDHGLERLVTRSDAGLLQGALAARGLRRNVAVTTPHFLAAWRRSANRTLPRCCRAGWRPRSWAAIAWRCSSRPIPRRRSR